ncbi:MAG: hypothetical protein K6F39_06975 [Lachnospiraceae bacterium]|nr:hypothetical protein [Lachnospiraceae bacterium]
MNLKREWRQYIFFIVNIVVFTLTLKSVYAGIIAVFWIITPYLMAPFLVQESEKSISRFLKPLFYILMLVGFLYLMHYDWIIIFKKLPYFAALKFLGLSYLLFREVDYTMQYEYLREMKVRITIVDYINYVLNFYTIMAGPIMRYEEFVTDFYDSEKPALDGNAVMDQAHRIIFGYVKVYVISSFMSWFASYWFGRISEAGNLAKAVIIYVLFAVFNALFIYFNFVGYCDVVAGGAALCGMTLRENFNKPYMARSMTEFWNRHHITLSEWIRDYIYSPVIKKLISGPCKKNLFAGQCAALFITFLIAGIWHGTNLNYVVYGLLEGLGVVISSVRKSKLQKKYGKKGYKEYEKKLPVIIFEHAWTMLYVALSFSFVGYDVIGFIMERV